MLDLELLRRQPEEVSQALTKRGSSVDIEPILDADRRRR